LAQSLDPVYLEKADTLGNYQVFIVDGTYIRGKVDEEFTNFDQHSG
jgi:hypothetical protein